MPSYMGIRILVIDDEPGFASALARLFRRDGAMVTTAANGRLALDQLRTQVPYDVILCDVTMPDLNGQDFFLCLCRCFPRLCPRVVFVTGDLDSPAFTFVQQSGQPWLAKPVMAATIRHAVQRVLHQASAGLV